MYTLYHSPVSGNSYKVLLALEQLGLPYDLVEVDVIAGATRTDTFAHLNPKRRVPVLVTGDGQVLTESNAILWYIARGTKLMPGDPFAEAQVLEWMFFEQNHLEPNLGLPRRWIALEGKAGEHAREIEQRQAAGRTFLQVVEARLAGHRFLVAEHYSIADICLYASIHVCHEGGYDLTSFPAIRGWLERVAAQPRHLRMAHR